MQTSKDEYSKLVKKYSPNSPKLKDFIWAFSVGGLICAFGQVIFEILKIFDIKEEISKMLIPLCLITISAVLTGLKVFSKIAKHAGAGTLVPITGFANAVVSPAIEFKSEGFILGVGVKMFTIAGPVIVYGTLASVIYGFIYWIIKN